MRHRCISNKKVYTMIKASILLVIFTTMVIICSLPSLAEGQDEWQVTIKIEATHEISDTLTFGEKLDASGGIDQYDMPKPPEPQPPYIRAWFTTDLSAPHHMLWEEYQSLSKDANSWNFTVRYVDDTENTSVVTLSWTELNLQESGYTSIVLSKEGQVVSNMLNENQYTYDQLSRTSSDFQIICQRTNNDTLMGNGSSTVVILIVLIFLIGIVFLYWFRTKRIKK